MTETSESLLRISPNRSTTGKNRQRKPTLDMKRGYGKWCEGRFVEIARKKYLGQRWLEIARTWPIPWQRWLICPCNETNDTNDWRRILIFFFFSFDSSKIGTQNVKSVSVRRGILTSSAFISDMNVAICWFEKKKSNLTFIYSTSQPLDFCQVATHTIQTIMQ